MKDFLQSAEEQLILNKDKDSIITELSDHVVTKKEFFESIGYDETASTEKANEAMGSGEIIGQRLDQLHSRKRLSVWLPIIGIITLNLVLNSVSPTGENPFFFPFIASLVILVFNFLSTAVAIRYKNIILSAALIVLSILPLLTENFRMGYPETENLMLAYPLCNLITLGVNRYDFYVYHFFRIGITVLLGVLIIVPNAVNIYHCRQIKQLKNTRKQNKIASLLRNACVIAVVAGFILSVPYYAMNERICDEQAAIRDELFGFVLDTVEQFDYNQWDELAEYLENCEYDFEYFENNYESDGKTYTYQLYSCHKGIFSINFSFNEETPDKYSADSAIQDYNLSMKHLYTTAEKIEDLIGKIGNSEVGPGNAMGHSAQEISDKFLGFDLREISIEKSTEGTVYKYSWNETRTYFDCHTRYEFYCDTEDICYYYELH